MPEDVQHDIAGVECAAPPRPLAMGWAQAHLEAGRSLDRIVAADGLRFRRGVAQDAPRVVPLVNDAYRGIGERLGWTHEKALVGGPRITEPGFRELLGKPGSVVLVAERAGQVVGCVHLQREGEACVLGMLSVDPKQQAGGVGRALMAEAERVARDELGARVMAMHVISVRQELLAWYERRGYRRTGHLEPFEAREGVRFLQGPLQFERLEKRLA